MQLSKFFYLSILNVSWVKTVMSDCDWLFNNKALCQKLNNVKHKFLWWGIFVVVSVLFLYFYINGMLQQVGQSSPYYAAVLIFIGGFFGSAYWDGFKWAVSCEDKTEITTSSKIEVLQEK